MPLFFFQYPDIVLVHYLNIPDRKTTFDDLVTSLLPFKTFTENELFCQLQPICKSNYFSLQFLDCTFQMHFNILVFKSLKISLLVTSGADERNNNTVRSVLHLPQLLETCIVAKTHSE